VMEEHFELTRSVVSCINEERAELMLHHGLDDHAPGSTEAAPASTASTARGAR
jgi:hypothetical protein